MNIKIAEVKLLLDNKIKELRDTYALRSQSLTDTFRLDKETKVEEKQNINYEFSVDELTARADKLENEILILKSALTTANCTIKTNFEIGGHKLTLQEAIIHIKALRESLNNIKYLGEQKEKRNNIDDKNYGGMVTKGYIEITRPTYNTKTYRDRYEKMVKLIQKLEVEISTANFTNDIEINGVSE
jgi:exonuclease VII small subunit